MTDPQSRKPRRPRGAPLDHAPEGVTYARTQAGLTKAALARKLKISKQLMGDIEAGRRNACLDLLDAMSEALGCPLTVLLAKPDPSISRRARPAPEPAKGAAPAP